MDVTNQQATAHPEVLHADDLPITTQNAILSIYIYIG